LVFNPLINVPVSYARLELLSMGKAIASTATDQRGYFKFTKALPDGLYELVLEPGDYEGKLNVTIAGGAPDVVLLAKRRPVN
jgi:aminopeptidase N